MTDRDERRRAWVWGYLTCLRLIRQCRANGCSWQEAVAQAGKSLTDLLQRAELPYLGGDDGTAQNH